MLFSVFTGSRPNTLLEIDNSPLKSSRESSIDDSLNNTLADNNDGDTLINDVFKSNAQNIKKPGTVYYGNINFFFLQNFNNLKRIKRCGGNYKTLHSYRDTFLQQQQSSTP
jgi:hypothetical protein